MNMRFLELLVGQCHASHFSPQRSEGVEESSVQGVESICEYRSGLVALRADVFEVGML